MKSKILVSMLVLLGGMFTNAATYKTYAEKGRVNFLAKGKPALILIKGEGEGATALLTEKDKTLKGTITFQLTSLKTGIELRDEHLKNKYLEIEKYPVATLKVSELKMPENLKKEFPFHGILNLHGIDQPVEGNASLTSESDKISARFKIKLSQFKIKIPSFQGITVAEEVEISVELPVVREE